MNDVAPGSRQKARVQALALTLVLLASGLEALALMAGAEAVRDLLLGLIALAMVAGAVGG